MLKQDMPEMNYFERKGKKMCEKKNTLNVFKILGLNFTKYVALAL